MGDTPPDPVVVPVRRFTTDYDIVQDRIRLTLERPDDTVLRLWLTRRLLVRAVPQLAGILDSRLIKRDGKPVPGDELSQRRDQLDALGRLEPQEPVPADEDVPDHLISAIGVRLTPKVILIDLKVGHEVVQVMPFSIPHMRQWLAVLNQCFRKGGWGDEVWPAWLKPAEPGQPPPGLRLN